MVVPHAYVLLILEQALSSHEAYFWLSTAMFTENRAVACASVLEWPTAASTLLPAPEVKILSHLSFTGPLLYRYPTILLQANAGIQLWLTYLSSLEPTVLKNKPSCTLSRHCKVSRSTSRCCSTLSQHCNSLTLNKPLLLNAVAALQQSYAQQAAAAQLDRSEAKAKKLPSISRHLPSLAQSHWPNRREKLTKILA
jgi:hypothetical protein